MVRGRMVAPNEPPKKTSKNLVITMQKYEIPLDFLTTPCTLLKGYENTVNLCGRCCKICTPRIRIGSFILYSTIEQYGFLKKYR
jgi:hypothetical protein